jgi:Chromo (CHRromatin Organisation MOdifier) domain
MSYVSNGVGTNVEQPQVRLKKIAAKTFNLKSPPPHQPASNGTDNLSSMESFRSAVTAEIDDGNVASFDEDAVNIETEDVIPPARLVASLSSPQPTSTRVVKKVPVKSTQKNPPKRKSNPTKQLKGGFWEVESILDVRKNGKAYEYLVQWKGDYENTWEPQKCLNKNALHDAKELLRAKMQEQGEAGAVE